MPARKDQNMVKKIGIIFLLVFVVQYAGRPQGAAPTGLAFAQLQDDGQPCPPECVTDSMEIVTWYPSPYNEYEELRLYPKRSAEESQCNSFEQLGLMYYNQDEQALKVCWQDPSDLSYSWEKIGSEQSGLSRLGNYATGARPNCSNAILGALVYDTTEKRPYVCALNASNSPVWKPLDSDYDRDGVTDTVDANDNDFNDATAVEANVEIGKTFYARGGSRKTGNMVVSSVGGICMTMRQDFPGGCGVGAIWCSDGSCPGATRFICEGLVGNAYCDSTSRCNSWSYLGSPCACPNGYALTQFYFRDIGDSRWIYGYYCKKN